MHKPDFWNWPPFMTVRRHNREITVVMERAQGAVNQEHARATKEGNARVHRFMVDANYNLVTAEGTGMYVAKVRAVFQQADREFRPEPLKLTEVLDAAAGA